LQFSTREEARYGLQRSVVIVAQEHRPAIRVLPDRCIASRTDGASLARIIAAAVPVFSVPYILFYRLVLYHFYVRGSFLVDTGLLGSLMWRNTFALNMPASLGGQSFYAIHAAPLLSLVSAISFALPVTMPQMLAGFIGVSHGLLALAMFWLLVEGHGMRRGWPLGLAALASTVFAFNGLAIAIARYPHFEIFGAACLLLFFVALVLERWAIAIVSLLLALATREDFGLHAFGFLTVWLAVNWLRSVSKSQKAGHNSWLASFAAVALIYSIIALLSQHWEFPASSSFVRIYLGQPAFSHVSWSLLAMHGFGWIMIHSAILLPAAAILVWAERTRDPFIIAGYVACIPWTLLHLFAVSDHAGWMVGYYAFPFLIAMAWPMLAHVEPGARVPVGSLRPAFLVLGLVALSLLPISPDFDPGKIPLPGAFLHAPSAEQQRQTDRAVLAIAAARPMLGRLMVDGSVAALMPHAFPADEIPGLGAEGHANTVVFFEDGFDSATLGAVPDLPVHFAVPGTEIRIMTDRPESILRETQIPR
jgi:hypothetical protein